MDSTTPSWKNTVLSRQFTKGLVACLLLLCLVPDVRSSDINVDFATSTLVDNEYHVDASISFKFDDEVLTALAHGIPLRIDTRLKIKRERDWLWNPVVRDETISFQLQRHALSDHYLLTNLKSGHKEQFQYLDEALRTMGTINSHFLFDSSTIDADASYVGFLRSRLNIEALPPPLRLSAYFSTQCLSKSDWYEWLVK